MISDNPTPSERPPYADFAPPEKFEAIHGIVAQHQMEHPNASCSYSGGGDSDTLIDIIERVVHTLHLPPVHYFFFNTGLEMRATKEHVKETAAKYNVEIREIRPKVTIIEAVRKYGIPFKSKLFSQFLSSWQKSDIPLSIINEFDAAPDKSAKWQELNERYPRSKNLLGFLLSCDKRNGEPMPGQYSLSSARYFSDFQIENPHDFQISCECCKWCKKKPAHDIEKNFEMCITGERFAEGGARAMRHHGRSQSCFTQHTDGTYRFKPLYYVTDADKKWYKEHYHITYSDAYELYGLTRTGCCGCSISSTAAENLEKIRPYEPNLVKAAWNVFGPSYQYRAAFEEYKQKRKGMSKDD